MTTVRCYLPLSGEQLAVLRAERRLDGPFRATAVTPEVRAAEPTADEDEHEYAAAQTAAGWLLGSGAPVLLAAVDVQERDVRLDSGPWVEVGQVDLPRVAALHLGDDVITGDPSRLPDEDEGIELSWFDTTELDHVLELTERLARTDTTGPAPTRPEEN
ncbi:DUF6912 family protein [Serinicoccus kebangsaanensis]|uniref:DUF6912 family protein n=1 Tax=Serinicoccus kebangsaanensis TaxID=2602069 RepID=UPI00124C51FC|nr:hypothetical protein [Serinicoccus kebangsaanensis]